MSEYIERERILIELAEAYDKIDPRSLKGNVIREAIASLAKNRINAIPAADVAPVKHGRWIMHEDEFLEIWCECSHCNIETFGDSPYCPNCGAKMDKGEEKC